MILPLLLQNCFHLSSTSAPQFRPLAWSEMTLNILYFNAEKWRKWRREIGMLEGIYHVILSYTFKYLPTDVLDHTIEKLDEESTSIEISNY